MQERFVRAFSEWKSTAPGGWLPPPPPPGSFQFQVPIEVLQYTPYRPGAMDEEKKNSNKGWENSTKKRRNLKILKIIGKNFKKCKCFLHIEENYFLYIIICHLFPFH